MRIEARQKNIFYHILISLIISLPPLFAQNEKVTENSTSGNSFIRRINIHRLDIFDTNQIEYKKFPFPLINKLHIKTKHRVVKRELLFDVGDTVDTLLLAESERNLRALQFINNVQIEPISRNNDSTDISVTVEDQWTTNLGTKYEMQAGCANYGIRLEEYNLFGWGQRIKASIARIDNRIQKEFYFLENRLFNTRLSLDYFYKKLEYGKAQSVSIGRPFFSERTKWAAEANYSEYRGNRYFFENENENEFASYKINEIQWNLRTSYLLFRHQHKSARISLLLNQFKENLLQINFINSAHTFEPQFDNNQLAGIGIDWMNVKYIKETFINNFGNIEDISLGYSGSLYLGRTLKYLGTSDNCWYLMNRMAKASTVGRHFYFYSDIENFTYLNETHFEQIATRITIKSYYNKFRHHTLAFNTEFTAGWRMPNNRQLFLGENRGVRGYTNYFRTGQKRVVINLEDRIYPRISLYSFGFGAALFTDFGYIWNSKNQPGWKKPYATAGVGLRIGNTKAKGSAVMRFDLAITFLDEPKLVFSFGNSHFFSAFHNFDFISIFPKKFGEYKE